MSVQMTMTQSTLLTTGDALEDESNENAAKFSSSQTSATSPRTVTETISAHITSSDDDEDEEQERNTHSFEGREYPTYQAMVDAKRQRNAKYLHKIGLLSFTTLQKPTKRTTRSKKKKPREIKVPRRTSSRLRAKSSDGAYVGDKTSTDAVRACRTGMLPVGFETEQEKTAQDKQQYAEKGENGDTTKQDKSSTDNSKVIEWMALWSDDCNVVKDALKKIVDLRCGYVEASRSGTSPVPAILSAMEKWRNQKEIQAAGYKALVRISVFEARESADT
jgi:hypothetical protein